MISLNKLQFICKLKILFQNHKVTIIFYLLFFIKILIILFFLILIHFYLKLLIK